MNQLLHSMKIKKNTYHTQVIKTTLPLSWKLAIHSNSRMKKILKASKFQRGMLKAFGIVVLSPSLIHPKRCTIKEVKTEASTKK